jgi:hypothetical protein
MPILVFVSHCFAVFFEFIVTSQFELGANNLTQMIFAKRLLGGKNQAESTKKPEPILLTNEEVAELEQILLGDVMSIRVQAVLRGYTKSQAKKTNTNGSLVSSIYDWVLPSADKEVRSLEEVYMKQVELKDALHEEEMLLKGDDTPTPTGESPKPFDKIAYEQKLITKRMREEKLMRNNRFYCKGELEAHEEYAKNKKNRIIKYELTPTLTFDCDAEDIHFRVIESQIQSRVHNGYGYTCNNLSSITYIVNPILAHKFEEKRKEFAKKYEMLLESVKPLLLFHGTKLQNIDPICENNFSIAKLGGNTGNRGYYGAGIYFSCHPQVSLGYSGSNTLLACLVIVGRAFISQHNVGCSLTEGYDSHTSPDGTAEVVIFNPDQVLPCYIVKF